jgi:predicted nucleic acid-binding protein
VIVVDTNLICYLYLESEWSQHVEKAIKKDREWTAPILWRSEMRNVLALYVRKKILRLEDAQQIIESASQLMKGGEYEVASSHVLSLAASSGCSAYDCEFVALAKDLDLYLVTLDRQVLAKFPETAISLEAFVSV